LNWLAVARARAGACGYTIDPLVATRKARRLRVWGLLSRFSGFACSGADDRKRRDPIVSAPATGAVEASP